MDDLENVFFCDGCGKDFPADERADLGEPYCVACWERLPHDIEEDAA